MRGPALDARAGLPDVRPGAAGHQLTIGLNGGGFQARQRGKAPPDRRLRRPAQFQGQVRGVSREMEAPDDVTASDLAPIWRGTPGGHHFMPDCDVPTPGNGRPARIKSAASYAVWRRRNMNTVRAPTPNKAIEAGSGTSMVGEIRPATVICEIDGCCGLHLSLSLSFSL